MSRITDTERGARIAREIAEAKLRQGDLFDRVDRRLWQSIHDRACLQLVEEMACRRELTEVRWHG